MGWVHIVGALCALHATSGYLLSGDVTPSHYQVELLYDIDPATNYSFYGLVDITLRAKKAVSEIVLHAQGFSIVNDKITVAGSADSPAVTEVSLNQTFDMLTLGLDKALVENEDYTLTIPFYGNLKAGLDGVYISSYVNKASGQKEYLIATQFEAISARKGFPCFDEPMYKATFSMIIGHHKNFTATSNMPLLKTTNDNVLDKHWPSGDVASTFKKNLDDFVFDHFQKSVPMSTYLVAFVVSKFSYVESPAGLSTTKFKIWARSDAIDQTAYAATIGPKVLSHFEKWFNVTFPLPKQDMFAIPDFSAGAMENWGLITYREVALLYDKKQSSFVNKERVAEVIAHELAHQWFGNLVTMKWWSDLWLNEGFATFAASVGVASVEPAWRADRNYAISNIMSVLSLDALETSHPVSVPLDDPKRISEIFDEISYRKGSTLIRMMTMFLGENVFKEAIHNYLVKYSYKNAEQDDLWAELTAASARPGGLPHNVTVKTIMDTWTTRPGYPLLTVQRDYETNTASVTQKRYLSLGAVAQSASSWWIPLRVMCQHDSPSEAEELEWLGTDQGVDTQHQFNHNAGPQDWLLFNADMIGLYRVKYDARNWALLSETLRSDKFSSIPVLGRVQLLSDAFELAWSNEIDYDVPLQLASYLQRESEYLPLETGLRALSKIENVLKREPDYGAFQKYVRKLIRPTYERVGGMAAKKILNGDDLNSVKMQLLTSNWACRMKVPGCEENAIELFQSWMDTENPDENNPIPLDLRRTVYCAGVSRGSVREWRFTWERAARANVAAARDALQHALTCTRELWLLRQYLEWTIDDSSGVRRQDAAHVIVGITYSPIGYYVAKEFIYTRIKDIYTAFNSQGRRLGYIIKTLLDQFTTQRELDEFLSWHKENKSYLEDARLAVSQAIEKARVNIGWAARHRVRLLALLREHAV